MGRGRCYSQPIPTTEETIHGFGALIQGGGVRALFSAELHSFHTGCGVHRVFISEAAVVSMGSGTGSLETKDS